MTEADVPGAGVRENYRRQGAEQEQARIVEAAGKFWCGEPLCEKHFVNMAAFLDYIKGKAE